MTMKKSISTLFAFLTLILVLCSSCATPFEKAGKALEQGDYARAIAQSIEALKEEPGMSEAQAVLRTAWQRANTEWNAQIATIEKATTAKELEKAIAIYNKLLGIHSMVENAGRSELNPNWVEVRERAMNTQQRVADMYFEEGSVFLAKGGRDGAREAIPYFNKVKNLSPNYPNIDSFISQATQQATVKVFVVTAPDKNSSINSIEMLHNVDQQLSRLNLVESVGPSSRYPIPLENINDAKLIAQRSGANIMLFLEPNTTLQVETLRELRSLNSYVTAASWKVEKLSMVASGSSEIFYKVIDLETNTTLGEGTFTATDSTDFGFSVSSIIHSGGKITKQIGNMAKEESLLRNSTVPGESITSVKNQLKVFEKMDLEYTGIAPARYGTFEPIDFNRYTTPDELAKIAGINGHMFALFDVVESSMIDNPEDKYYDSLYGEYMGDGFAGKVKTAQFDRKVYNELNKWMNNRDTKHATLAAFSSTFIKDFVSNQIISKVSPLLR